MFPRVPGDWSPDLPLHPRARRRTAGVRMSLCERLLLTLAFTVTACGRSGASASNVVHDLVVVNGRVMDPASGLDAVRAIGISGGAIRAIADVPLHGRDTIDARGAVVAPGVIDLHQHAQDSAAYRVEVLDGTTTALELEGGTADVDGWYAARAGTSLINHGVSVGHDKVRRRVMGDTGARATANSRATTADELKAMLALIDRGLQRGAVATGMLIEFTPGATPWEILEVFRVAAKYGASVHVHMRGLAEPYYFLETEEVIAASAATGAAAHIVHIQSSVGEDTPRALSLIRGARARGLDVTTEVYPYTASMSEIEAADNDDWQSWPDRKFARMEWAKTGRVQVGADADLVVFDPNTVSDRATYREPTLPPLGIAQVLVNGVRVVRDGAVVAGRFPGKPVRAPLK